MYSNMLGHVSLISFKLFITLYACITFKFVSARYHMHLNTYFRVERLNTAHATVRIANLCVHDIYLSYKAPYCSTYTYM